MKKIFTLSLVAILFWGTKAIAQVPLLGSYNIPGPKFPNLKVFLDTLNYNGVSGPVTANLKQNEIAPSGGYILGSATLNVGAKATSLTSQLTITSVAGFPHTLTANAGTGGTDAIFTIQGTDFVTIQGINLKDTSTNTTSTSMMERGYSIVKFSTPTGNKDGVKSLSIKGCTVTLNNTNTTAATGVAPFGAAGIYIGNCLYGATTALSSSAYDTFSHDGIYLNLDTIQNVNQGVFAYGINIAIDGINNNDRGITLQTNLIQNFTHNGVALQFFNNDQVLSNIINNTLGGGTAPITNNLFGVIYNNGTATNNTNWTCSNNNINLTINSTSTSPYIATAISTQVYGTGTTTISGDTIQMTSSGTSAQLNGIFNQNNLGTLAITGNVIKNFTTQTTNTQAVLGIFAGGYSTYLTIGTSTIASYPTTCTVSGNLIDNFNVSSGTASNTSVVMGCLDDNLTTNPSNFTNNTVSNIVINANSNRFSGYGGIWNYGAVSLPSVYLRTATVTGNTFKNISTIGTNDTTPVYIVQPKGTYPSSVTLICSSNYITNVSTNGNIIGFALDGGLTATLDKDTVTNLRSNNQTLLTPFVMGMSSGLFPSNTTTVYNYTTVNLTNSSFAALKDTDVVSPFGAIVAAAFFAPGSSITMATSNVYNNTFRDISTNDTTGLAYGIRYNGGTATSNIYNNMISDIIAAADTLLYNSSFGIDLNNSGTNNVYYNTVNMVTSATTAIAGYGSTGLRYNSGTTNTIQNNILRVNVTAGTLNNAAAIRAIAGTPLSAPSIAGFTASNNIYYTPIGPRNFLYVEGTTTASLANGYNFSGLTPNITQNIVNDTFFNSTCNRSSYHKFMNGVVASRESGTFSENNLTGASGIYTPTGISYAESGGTAVSVITDMSATSRGSSPDMGALQFAGTVRPTPSVIVVSSTGLDTACTGNLPKLSASIPAFFNHVSYQWYKDTSKIPGATTTTTFVSTISASYTMQVYDSLTGCTYSSAPFKMTVMPPPPAFITYYDSLTFCQTSAVALHANSGRGYIYQWYKNGIAIPGETNDIYVASTTGTYSVQVNTALGCPTMSTTLKVKVYPLPTPTIFLIAPRVLSTQNYYLYQWYKNNVLIPDVPGASSTGRNYLAPTDGAYTVEVTDSNGCTAKSTIYLFSLGIDNVQLGASIKIYPNPTTGLLKIESPVALNASLTDITGRVVFTTSEIKEMDLSNYAEGLYILSLTDKEGRLVKIEKITKAK